MFPVIRRQVIGEHCFKVGAYVALKFDATKGVLEEGAEAAQNDEVAAPAVPAPTHTDSPRIFRI